MFMQAWGHYGTAWPVIHQQLGVRPDARAAAPRGRPGVPAGQTRIAGRAIRIGDAARSRCRPSAGRRYTTAVTLRGATCAGYARSHAPARASKPGEVALDGRRVGRGATARPTAGSR